MDWQEIVDKYNLGIHYDTLRKSQQPTPFGGAFIREYFINKMSSENNEDNYLKELQVQKRELAKEKVKMRDERNELSRLIREQARRESFIDLVKRSFSEIEPDELKYETKEVQFMSDNDLLVHLTDIHTGLGINNFFNKFDDKELEKRLCKYLDKIFEIQKRHNSENVYVVIGEIISGLIHENLRIENNENVIAQFMVIATYISNFLEELSKVFNNVHVYVTAGNHSRVVANKNESINGENFDYLLPFYTRAKLQNYKNIFIHDNEVEESIAMFNVRGNTIMAAHGDKDSPSSVVQNFTMMFGVKPDIVLLGHRHTNGLSTVFDSKVIESGCVSGTDSYALSIRKKNRPEQTVSVITEDGLDCLYDIKLN